MTAGSDLFFTNHVMQLNALKQEDIMKPPRVMLAIILLLLGGGTVKANPIPWSSFSELLFTGNGWALELHGLGTSLDGWSLGSRSGTALFKNGIYMGAAYVVITQDSLLSQLDINPLGDSLTLHSPQFLEESFVFGNSPYSAIASPRTGQSICWHQGVPYGYYLDNSPTPGLPNDTSNALGMIRGLVTDSLGQPIAGVSVWEWNPDFPVILTLSDGRFTLTDWARRASLRFEHAGFYSRSITVQVWPESTAAVTIVMSRIVSVDEGLTAPGGYALLPNHPNPFNPGTTFMFTIPRRSFVTLEVYDIHGREVATVVKGVREPGSHEVQWDASGVASGVYFYRLIAGDFMQTRKMLLMR